MLWFLAGAYCGVAVATFAACIMFDVFDQTPIYAKAAYALLWPLFFGLEIYWMLTE